MGTVFLIGGSGFIGKNLASYLSNSYLVHVFDKFVDWGFFDTLPSVKATQMDLVKELIDTNIEDPDYIINLASIVTAERNFELFDGLISSNLKVLLRLYERFKNSQKLKLFIQFGSSEEYGSEGSPFVETMREEPNSPYALVKQLTVNTALMLQKNYGFPAMVVRPGNLFGPMQNISKFIPYVITQLKQNLPLDVTLCEQKRDFIHTEDFSWCIARILENSNKAIGQIVNVSSGESLSLKSIIEYAKQTTGSTSAVNYGAKPYRENEVMDLRCDVTKLESTIGKNIKFDIYKRLEEYIYVDKLVSCLKQN